MSLINCPECGLQISNEASSCPHCGFGSKIKGKSGGCSRSVIQIFGVIVLFAVFMNICSDEKILNDKDSIAADTVYNEELLKIDKSPSETTLNSDSEGYEQVALILAEDIIKEKLKSPSTAEFPGLFESINHVKYIGDNKYQIDSWVDSQNSFGATIRTRYSCIMVKEGDYNWSMYKLQIY